MYKQLLSTPSPVLLGTNAHTTIKLASKRTAEGFRYDRWCNTSVCKRYMHVVSLHRIITFER